MITILVLFDFSKAFDTIPHKKLLKKLHTLCECSDRSLRWLFTNLHEKVQAVIEDGGSISAWLKTLAGILQGIVLRPLTFLTYINDLSSALMYYKRMIFAGGTQIYLHCDLDDVVNAMK